MARSINRLSDRAVKASWARGLYPDGSGLYLQVSAGGAKSWVFRFKRGGRARDMGLGPVVNVSLAEARRKARDARELLGQGIDPIEARDAKRAQETLARARATTFRDCAQQMIEAHEAGWRNAKHRQQWRNTLANYAYPILGDLPVGDVDTDLVLKVLQQPATGRDGKKAPLWNAKSETAGRVRGRIEAVLSSAKARGMRSGENPAQWRGHLDQLLPPRSKVRRVVHHPALPYRDIPAFMSKLRARAGITPRALEFVILTAARTGEALGARWDEIDLNARLWVVSAERMKGGREHRVPLSPRAVAILKEMAEIRMNDLVFPGMKRGRPLSDMSLLMLLRDLHPGITTHGFRSTFKDWCAECTHTPNFLSEAALAHVVADKVEAAYRRADLLERRRELMDAWGEHCASKRARGDRRQRRRTSTVGSLALAY